MSIITITGKENIQELYEKGKEVSNAFKVRRRSSYRVITLVPKSLIMKLRLALNLLMLGDLM